jgi:putative transposase
VGRDQVSRHMRAAGMIGARRGRRVRTTKPDATAARHPDLVRRKFTAPAPNQLWVSDLTFVPTWAGVAYVCFIVDAYSRMIVGWRVASHMRTTMVLDAVEMARWSRGNMLPGLISHSDAGSQFTSIRYGERLAEIGAIPSIGSIGDSFDNALAETVNGYYKSELIYGPARSGPWKTVEDVEVATLGWVHWHNTGRLHGYLGDIPPAEFEAAF